MDSPFWFVGNHLAVDFANTVVGADQRPDALRAWQDDLSFLVQAGVVDEGEARRLQRDARARGGEADAHAAALQLRGTVRAIIEALAAGERAPAAAVRQLNAELRAVPSHPELVLEAGGWALREEPAAPPWRAALARIARAAAELVAQPRGSIRKCANPACVLYFRDASQAQARRWCSMAVCGNRAKVAAHTRRAASATGPRARSRRRPSSGS